MTGESLDPKLRIGNGSLRAKGMRRQQRTTARENRRKDAIGRTINFCGLKTTETEDEVATAVKKQQHKQATEAGQIVQAV